MRGGGDRCRCVDRRSRVSWHPRIPVRLFALAMIPVLGVMLFAIEDIRDDIGAGDRARALLAGATSIEVLWRATAAAETELAVAAAVATWSSAAYGTEGSDDLLDTEVISEIRGATDRALEDLKDAHAARTTWVDSDGATGLVDALQAVVDLRPDIAAGSITRATIDSVRRRLEPGAVEAEIEAFHEQPGMEGEDLLAALDSAETSLPMIAAASEELLALAAYTSSREADRLQSFDGLIVAAEAFDSALDGFRGRLPVDDQAEFDFVVRRDDAWLDYHAERDAATTGALRDIAAAEPGSRPVDEGDREAVLEAGLARLALVGDYSGDKVADLVEEAADLGDGAAGPLGAAFFLAAGVILFTTLLSTLTARSIARPMRRLEERAAAISRGEIPPSAKPGSGPDDILAVEHAMDDLAEYLLTIQRQAAALADSQLDGPVFDVVAPGRLGRSVHDSVQKVRELTARLDHEANHDLLTGLANRAATVSLLERSLAAHEDGQGALAAIMLDLDGFKYANDVMGHQAGDELLKQVADRLREVCIGHHVGRLGGDEFLVVVDPVEDPASVRELADRVAWSIRQPYSTTAGTAWLTAGAGIAFASANDRLSPSGLLKHADLAMYEAKAKGRGEIVTFDQRLQDDHQERGRIQRKLRAALENDEFDLHFQALIDIPSGAPSRVEALLRWFPPGRAPLYASAFIPAAEQTELIIEFDEWVIDRACRYLRAWSADPILTGLPMSINISGRHISSTDLITVVSRALQANDVAPGSLVIEVTETQLIPHLDQAIHVMEGLRDLGVTLSVDDFGTGYASVAHLRCVEFGEIKIDGSFIANLDRDPDRSIADVLARLGRDLGLEVVAEGIETAAELAWVEAAGCTQAQGFHIADSVHEDALREDIVRLRADASAAPHPSDLPNERDPKKQAADRTQAVPRTRTRRRVEPRGRTVDATGATSAL